MCSAAGDPYPHAMFGIGRIDSKMCAASNEAEEVAGETLECHWPAVRAAFGIRRIAKNRVKFAVLAMKNVEDIVIDGGIDEFCKGLRAC